MPVLNREDKHFPQALLSIRPLVHHLSISGMEQAGRAGRLFGKRLLTVVGSRKMTRYGQQVVEKLIPPLVRAGVTIVSGFMYGVDQYVHQITLDEAGLTMAVLGWGIDWPVLPVERRLYDAISQKGLLISEYPNQTKPQLWMFPARDRIMAGLSPATLVIEAAKKSGSLITARLASRYRRKVFAVPGPITSAVSAGTNSLIKSGQALAVDSSVEILAIMGWPLSPQTTPRGCYGLIEKSKALNFLANEPLTIDELAKKCQQPVAQISADLSLLQIKGLVNEDNGKYFLKQLC
ncbi:hypothetical protein A2403_04000 [Candidatus Roizmanbacteria bacterium RIFOXYC1_FULL_41_16]|nr:MAG: hypothetical protein A2377_03470 [Candidatus Roizmanbacteria bacterium RIFOXYB1_FULL_41_27]OGK72475.1 MAG: hypothetical protein A2403_04000 [Candidatus Roizmanbacteria bacterium RIFOXYC1_FULL_41_16]OGK75407.1 MAG: hypothetical protein A2459_01645 [Candidatus Roizmanbacteria bacterium RIFOXYC2_FULL_41_10]